MWYQVNVRNEKNNALSKLQKADEHHEESHEEEHGAQAEHGHH